ncbi:MAG: transketolase C-terminal domain-containing protein [Phascolarctobacterium sp.]|uniref:transketolase family protein n=1 Tax=Phascolarctobacterium sp. TaxID=2049039 RepID=UPI0026DDB6E8|nr:transketolase C-terminal domain-containing protein [Phascolarctobacterium sp.]MDO4921597.1 transketolase C-terminal domain-containing protein [Phascolarctobacterium sp.]
MTRVCLLRDVIGRYMLDLGNLNDKVVVVNADLSGTCRTKKFADIFPERSYNVGIAEQNLVSFAAGLAHEGYLPYAFTMAPFISMRACEQCRSDVAYANLQVRLIATYAGCSGGISGATHWAIEDCAIMQSMPNMVVMEPSDAMQARKMMAATILCDSPIYIRSSVVDVADIYSDEYEFKIDKASYPKAGKDATIICSGVVVQYALRAARLIEEKTGSSIEVIDMHTIKPIDEVAVINAGRKGPVLVAQDHNVVGGLGYSVASKIAEAGIKTRFKILGIPDKFMPMAHAPYLYNQFGYDTHGLVSAMLNLLQ